MKIRRRFAVHSGMLFLIVLLFFKPIHAQKRAADDLLVLNNVTVVDVQTGALQPEQTVILERNHIASVGPSKLAKYPRNATSVNCRGLFLIPGLWDMHVHLVFGDWFPDAQDISLPLFVANGVTGVRDMGSELDIVQGWRNEIEAGRLIGPRIYTPGPMLDGPKPRFPSSVAIATPEDAHRAVADLKRRGADFIKLQSLIPRDAVFAIAEEAKKQEIPFEGHVPDTVRASEMSEAGMKSFEHLIGIFEGSSANEDDFLKGNKTEGRFLAAYDPARAASLASILAKNQTWQCPTLVWERGGNLIDASDFSKDTRAKYVPASWKSKTWKRFTDEITQGYGTDDLAIRKRFLEKELEVVGMLHKTGVPFLAGTDTPRRCLYFPRLQPSRGIAAFRGRGIHSPGSAANRDDQSRTLFRNRRTDRNGRKRKARRPGSAFRQPSRRYRQHAEDCRCHRERPVLLPCRTRQDARPRGSRRASPTLNAATHTVNGKPAIGQVH